MNRIAQKRTVGLRIGVTMMMMMPMMEEAPGREVLQR